MFCAVCFHFYKSLLMSGYQLTAPLKIPGGVVIVVVVYIFIFQVYLFGMECWIFFKHSHLFKQYTFFFSLRNMNEEGLPLRVPIAVHDESDFC